jgi:hypothetical protein
MKTISLSQGGHVEALPSEYEFKIHSQGRGFHLKVRAKPCVQALGLPSTPLPPPPFSLPYIYIGPIIYVLSQGFLRIFKTIEYSICGWGGGAGVNPILGGNGEITLNTHNTQLVEVKNRENCTKSYRLLNYTIFFIL